MICAALCVRCNALHCLQPPIGRLAARVKVLPLLPSHPPCCRGAG